MPRLLEAPGLEEGEEPGVVVLRPDDFVQDLVLAEQDMHDVAHDHIDV